MSARDRRPSRALGRAARGHGPCLATLRRVAEQSAGAAVPDPTTWVTVPVPEWMLDRVQVFVMHLTLRGTRHAWSPEAMRDHLDRLDERTRAMVRLVARRALDGAPLTTAELAERLAVHVREVFGLMHLANDVEGVPRPDLLWTEPEAEGASPVQRVMMMTEHLAELIVSLDRGGEDAP